MIFIKHIFSLCYLYILIEYKYIKHFLTRLKIHYYHIRNYIIERIYLNFTPNNQTNFDKLTFEYHFIKKKDLFPLIKTIFFNLP